MTGISRRGYAKPRIVQKNKSFPSERTVPSAPRLLDRATRCSRKVQDNIPAATFFPSMRASGPSEPLVTGHHP
jgi:hypothetical protein